MQLLDLVFIQKIFKPRFNNSHKGTHGKALIIAGSTNKMGAAIIAAKACLRAGVGLLTVAVPKNERQSLFISLPEAMLVFQENCINFANYQAIAIGPGLGTSYKAKILFKTLLHQANDPLVIDADALNLLAQNTKLLTQIPKNSIITPHVKEFDRIFGNHTTLQDQQSTAIQKAKELQIVIVLKGPQTIITNGYDSYQNTTGNSGLAKGGSGDGLTGIITALLAQNYLPLHAAALGVYLHGLSADNALQHQSPESMLITDVIDQIGTSFKQITP